MIYRRSGTILLLLGLVAVSFMSFTPFRQDIGRWTVDDDGDWRRAQILCPSAVAVVFTGAQAEDARNQFERDQCVKGAWGKLVVSAFVGVTALVLGIRGFRRGPRPEPIRLRPLSEIIGGLKQVTREHPPG